MENDSERELLPCPFCGEQPYPCTHKTYQHYGVTCKCGASGATGWAGPNPTTPQILQATNEGVAAWNRRADQAGIVAEAARYRFLRDTPDSEFRPFALRRGNSPAKADATVDARMKVLICDRCGARVESLTRTTADTKYKGCDVCANCLEELEPGRARSTPATGAPQ